MTRPPTLTYLYGPPAVGKLTVATELAAVTGHRLFHNHLTNDALLPLFEFRSAAFTKVLHRFRLDVFTTAMSAGIDVIFTNNSAWGGDDARERFIAFVAEVTTRVENAGGRVALVQLSADPDDLVARVSDPSRHEHHKLTEATRMREILAEHDPSPMPGTTLSLDTSVLSPLEAATEIAALTNSI